ncbi:MAG: hypothetical protein MJE77_21810 [Proteobacteria bacterium]|nr:hypothetical protein [Pseudomonadota bacterium]
MQRDTAAFIHPPAWTVEITVPDDDTGEVRTEPPHSQLQSVDGFGAKFFADTQFLIADFDAHDYLCLLG